MPWLRMLSCQHRMPACDPVHAAPHAWHSSSGASPANLCPSRRHCIHLQMFLSLGADEALIPKADSGGRPLVLAILVAQYRHLAVRPDGDAAARTSLLAVNPRADGHESPGATGGAAHIFVHPSTRRWRLQVQHGDLTLLTSPTHLLVAPTSMPTIGESSSAMTLRRMVLASDVGTLLAWQPPQLHSYVGPF